MAARSTGQRLTVRGDDSAERRRYRNLRLVARVAELHRTLVLDEEVDARSTLIGEAASGGSRGVGSSDHRRADCAGSFRTYLPCARPTTAIATSR